MRDYQGDDSKRTEQSRQPPGPGQSPTGQGIPGGEQFGQPQQQPPQQMPMGQPTQPGPSSQAVQGGQPTQQQVPSYGTQQPPQQLQPPTQQYGVAQQPHGVAQQPQPQPSMQQGQQMGTQYAPPTGQPQTMGTQTMGAQQQATAPAPGVQQPARRGRRPMTPVDVRDIIQTDVVAVQPDAAISEVASKMGDQDVGCVIVVEGEQPRGVLTDRKIALALSETEDVSGLTASDLLSGDLVVGTDDMSMFDLLDTLGEHNIRRLPIVDGEGSLSGIITLDDFLVLFGSELGTATSIIKSQSPRL
ncbi:CBS domain-containing protein [Haloarculaceae archaeon H-GB2-1]|nr:CBS domain-containing protein [Haloarculaceae archaeon H-GB1-1]MEA5389473.1 CBS domain-containing protein [Haloarculaceae archaeon H-GB11]MEA5410075.1 CBS domain-containing protein [Haloarculaceae archaeon H-GB2-1]